ncbi:hypothetical protein E1301_Tti012953 [Triplophysa tibetana]|uniref:Uncharacterized protein n=1 Tax=Triplophysa tibetana TaxID=1572043 RepID=A0A5A9NU30_9TELE|nr:hypothetical protein E1301_Tti012953 [Triplophysa tibetana]
MLLQHRSPPHSRPTHREGLSADDVGRWEAPSRSFIVYRNGVKLFACQFSALHLLTALCSSPTLELNDTCTFLIRSPLRGHTERMERFESILEGLFGPGLVKDRTLFQGQYSVLFILKDVSGDQKKFDAKLD